MTVARDSQCLEYVDDPLKGDRDTVGTTATQSINALDCTADHYLEINRLYYLHCLHHQVDTIRWKNYFILQRETWECIENYFKFC